MNYLQFSAFIFYLFSTFVVGVSIYSFFNSKKELPINKITYLGEIFLLGGIFIVGELLFLSLLGAYKAQFLWAAVIINCLPIFIQNVRRNISFLWLESKLLSISNILFFIIIGVLIFRNIYYMVDADSNSTYLYIQKLWLSKGTSLLGTTGHDVRIFLPHFDTVPSALGISIFGVNSLFPQLISIFWRVVALLLVFGYTKYRFKGLTALAAVMLIAFNDHFFYSGANQWVLINGALIALLFACVYNFWQARAQNSPFCLFMAFIFLTQLMANKYQMAYIFILLLIVGVFIQKERFKFSRMVWLNARWRWGIIIAGSFSSLWYIKNFIVTGNPFFPIFAGHFGAFEWSVEQSRIFGKIMGGRSFFTVIKYLSYFFIWPGIKAAKVVLLSFVFLPLTLVKALLRSNLEKEKIVEVCYWMGLSVFGVISICIASHQDPRYFRYLIAIFSFSAVLSIHFIFKYCLNIKKTFIAGMLLFLFALSGYRIVGVSAGVISKRPTVQENLNVLRNKISMEDIIKKYFPNVEIITIGLKNNPEKAKKTAWEFNQSVNTPLFLLPQKPLVSLWGTTLIKWESYKSYDLIVEDLQKAEIEWVARMRNNKLIFVDIKDYAKEAVKLERFPNKIRFDYNFPQELKSVTY